MARTSTYVPTDVLGNPVGKRTRVASTEEPDHTEVPEGSVAVVREWVGYDPDRAKAALLREHASDKPRKGLIEALDHLVKEG